MDINKAIKNRHSVRKYTEQDIELRKREMIESWIWDINRKSGLHMQVFFDEPKCFSSKITHYGMFKGVHNYITIAGRKEDMEKAGYYGEELVLKCQDIGLNSCWVALTHGKTKASIARDEKLLVVIVIGYGETKGVPHKSKSMQALCTCDEKEMPEWFKKGMTAAMLAPTALNQQKFRFELKNGKVTASTSWGLYTKIDLGIVKYHFEAVSGHRVERE